jgi:hypothetical protein
MHNDKFQTFSNPKKAKALSIPKEEPIGVDFFDNNSFWSGSLTWY